MSHDTHLHTSRLRGFGNGNQGTGVLLSLVCALLLSLVVTTPSEAGVYYQATTRVTTDSGSQGTGDSDVEAWVEGDKAKVLFTQSENPMAAEGSYLITTDGGRILYMVNPKDKTYAEWDLEAMLQSVNAMMESLGGMVKFSFENVDVQNLEEGNGGEVLGYSTEYSKQRTSYDIEVRVLGIKRRSSMETVQEAWATQALNDEALNVWLQRPLATGNEELDELLKAQMRQIDGFPLKTVQASVTRDKDGDIQSRSTTVTEVTEVKRLDVPASTFEIPADYTETDAALPTGAAANDNEEEGEESENPFDSLRGLFKRN